MPADRRLYGLIVLGVFVAGTAGAQGQSPEEKRRGEILRELGLKKKKVPPVGPSGAGNTVAPSAGGAAEEAPSAGQGPSDRAPAKEKAEKTERTTPTDGPESSVPGFRRAIHPLVVSTCKLCHVAGGAAAATHLLLSGDADADYAALKRFVDTRLPAASPMLAKASGASPHGGGAPWPATSSAYDRVRAWIAAGARLDRSRPTESGSVPGPVPVPVRAPPAPPTPTLAPRSRVSTTGAGVAPTSSVATPVARQAEGAPPESPAPPRAEAAAPTKTSRPTFAADVRPILISACAACHGATGPAAVTRLVLSADAQHDEATARALLDQERPEESLLVTKASGRAHGGGPVLPAHDPRLQTIIEWARGVASAVAASHPDGGDVPPALPPGEAPSKEPSAVSPPAPPSGGPGASPGLTLPLGFMLNGRFDLDYERRQFSGNPFDSSGVNALRSYHHFLFLSRDAADEPCGLSVEILTLQFWEVHCRVTGLPSPFRLTVAAGKIVVPFGADPLLHQSYGGLAGFDQRILPVIWAEEGIAAHLVVQRRGFVLTDDLFVVRGYALPHVDSVLNLQSDFSPVDAAKLGLGNRLGAAWMLVSAWYSATYNPLGFGRRLFMQALDVMLWRPRTIPVLGHFSLAAGLLRADVSGGGAGQGGPGKDYYHFGSYFQVRYHPTDWLYVQYRQGLRTFDNRRGTILDNSRLTNADGSTHNFGVVARHRGLSVGLYYFIILEKVDEVPDDLLRLSVSYDF